MSTANPPESAAGTAPRPPASVLVRVTAVVLCAVMVSLAWMVSAAYQPDYFRLDSVEREVLLILGLLVTALVLVSVVALRHTRLPGRNDALTVPPDQGASPGG